MVDEAEEDTEDEEDTEEDTEDEEDTEEDTEGEEDMEVDTEVTEEDKSKWSRQKESHTVTFTERLVNNRELSGS